MTDNLPAKNHDYRDAIVRAAQDPNFNLDKFERLVAMQQDDEQRAGDRRFNEALSAAEAEMTTISANANNPQTRSNYATYARLDGAIRGIYTGHGFGVSFNTEPMGEPNMVRVVGMLSNGGIQRRSQIDMPIVTQGLRGGDMMTRTHATMSAISYGKRNLLIMMFNLSIGDDDDGNAAGGKVQRPPPQPGQNQNQAVNPNQSNMTARPPLDITDADSGEVTSTATADKINPCKITYDTSDDYRSWGEKLMWGVRRSTTIEEVDRWVLLNQENLGRLAEAKPVIRKTLQSAIDTVKEGITQA